MGFLLSAILGGLVALVLFKLWGGGSPAPALPRRQSRYTTVYLFPDGAGGLRVSATPEILYVRQGDRVEWTVVDASGRGGDVSFRIKQGDDPFEEVSNDPGVPDAGKRSAAQPGGPFTRVRTARIRADARFVPTVRYGILVNGVELFDPEIQMEE